MMDWRDEADTPERPERDPLDALLAQAAWPQPAAEQLARLQAHWRRRRRVPRRVGWWLAAAAAVVAAGMAIWLAAEGRRRLDRPANETIEAGSLLAEDAAPHAVPSDRRPAEDAPVLAASGADGQIPAEAPDKSPPVATADHSRPPNHYERLVLASAVRRQQGQPKPEDTGERAALLDEALESRAADAEADAKTLAAKLLPERERHERRLLDILSDARDERRAAAVELLPFVATWRSVPLLRELVATGQASGPARLALARLGTPDEAAWLVEAEADRALRIALLAVLAERGERAAVRQLLRFVADTRSTDDALQALDAVDEPPLDALFGALVGNDVGERRAAARALGRINGPTVTERLVALALDGIYRQEAMLALIACRGSEAREFVQHARRDLTLVAAVKAAEYQFQRITHTDERSIP